LTHSLKATGFKPLPLQLNPGFKTCLSNSQPAALRGGRDPHGDPDAEGGVRRADQRGQHRDRHRGGGPEVPRADGRRGGGLPVRGGVKRRVKRRGTEIETSAGQGQLNETETHTQTQSRQAARLVEDARTERVACVVCFRFWWWGKGGGGCFLKPFVLNRR
jgi:hypothetical protein